MMRNLALSITVLLVGVVSPMAYAADAPPPSHIVIGAALPLTGAQSR
ncbi:MAG: hypothetical protein HY278_10610 [candidate division NC10 bacterium]|nr:hypothetical protein [candidate division NC10 bacterium]